VTVQGPAIVPGRGTARGPVTDRVFRTVRDPVTDLVCGHLARGRPRRVRVRPGEPPVRDRTGWPVITHAGRPYVSTPASITGTFFRPAGGRGTRTCVTADGTFTTGLGTTGGGGPRGLE
jgi:hypothetical protein